jgi:Flp pilus assembly protein TadG
MNAAFRPSVRSERGQVLVIFAGAFVVIIMMLALLFDGGRGLLTRRELQNASDAAAMAAANIFQTFDPHGCSATEGPPVGAPRAEVVAAAQASVAVNLPDFDPADIEVNCLDGWDNTALQVTLNTESPTFFGSIFGTGPLDVVARSSAVNGGHNRNAYSVILLNPHEVSWPQQRRGCPSLLFSGGPTVIFDSSIYVNSACSEPNGGAMSTNGNATSLTLGSNGPRIRLVGEYKPQALTISPEPLEHENPKSDPLDHLLPPPTPPYGSTTATSLKVRATSKTIIGQGQTSGTVVLEPGVYRGGIELRNSSKAYLRPGIYVMYGGGLRLGAQTQVYSVDPGVTAQSFTTWPNSCHADTCGIMIYNAGDKTGATAMGQIYVAAGATFKVRSYDSLADTTRLNNDASYSNAEYDNMLIWQSVAPNADSTWAQPELQLNGGGTVEMSGTIYSPMGKVLMGGGSGGSGGSTITLTLQFIVWDLEISGNATFHFVYDGSEFTRPPDYGLIE